MSLVQLPPMLETRVLLSVATSSVVRKHHARLVYFVMKLTLKLKAKVLLEINVACVDYIHVVQGDVNNY